MMKLQYWQVRAQPELLIRWDIDDKVAVYPGPSIDIAPD